MDQPRTRSLFRSAHWMLLGLVLALGLSFWIGSAKFGKQVEDTYSDPHRLAALKTFEQAIEFAAPGKAYPAPTALALKQKFPKDSKIIEEIYALLRRHSVKGVTGIHWGSDNGHSICIECGKKEKAPLKGG